MKILETFSEYESFGIKELEKLAETYRVPLSTLRIEAKKNSDYCECYEHDINSCHCSVLIEISTTHNMKV